MSLWRILYIHVLVGCCVYFIFLSPYFACFTFLSTYFACFTFLSTNFAYFIFSSTYITYFIFSSTYFAYFTFLSTYIIGSHRPDRPDQWVSGARPQTLNVTCIWKSHKQTTKRKAHLDLQTLRSPHDARVSAKEQQRYTHRQETSHVVWRTMMLSCGSVRFARTAVRHIWSAKSCNTLLHFLLSLLFRDQNQSLRSAPTSRLLKGFSAFLMFFPLFLLLFKKFI